MPKFQIRTTKPHPVAMKTTNQDWHDKTYFGVGISTSTLASILDFFMDSSLKFHQGCLYFQINQEISPQEIPLGYHAEPSRQVWIIHHKCLRRPFFFSLHAPLQTYLQRWDCVFFFNFLTTYNCCRARNTLWDFLWTLLL